MKKIIILFLFLIGCDDGGGANYYRIIQDGKIYEECALFTNDLPSRFTITRCDYSEVIYYGNFRVEEIEK